MILDNYWPKAASVNACIKNEAETAEVSVLLAVHQPTPLAQRNAGTGLITPSTEEDLLDAFLTDDVPSGALLMPITGPSGVGKSHVVRWLDAQLQRSKKRDKLHIIRIPKSASLRTVVELILQPLAKNPRYGKIREELTRAVSEVQLNDAVITFRAHLENALNAKCERMKSELREHKDRTNLRSLIGHAQHLPRLFSDAALNKHFIEHVLSRIVQRALKGRSEPTESDETFSQFNYEDLILPSTVPLNESAYAVREYYQRNIAAHDPEKLKPVIDMLNEVVDSAIGNVFQLEQSTAGMSLQDIILAVREILLSEKMDLVLLIEDFAALAGIQEVLLKVCIQEGEREGKTIRATMRTALALTDGYLAFRDTILTRAQREWVVGGRSQSDDEIKTGVVEMAGAYLNAARWGEQELRHLFKLGAGKPASDWLKPWQDEGLNDEESRAVAAFGLSKAGYALFPFNEAALGELAKRHLTEGAKLIFNPRRVINEILRNTLLMRPSFEENAFPPTGFQDLRPNGALAAWIHQTHQPDEVSRRLSTMLAIWGGNPSDTTQIAHVPPDIFSTFNLPTPSVLADVKFVPQATTKATLVTPAAAKTPDALSNAGEFDSELSELRKKLDHWADGTQLQQDDARKIRGALAELVKDAIDWPNWRIRPQEIRPTWITIPNARGNQPGRQLLVCDTHHDEGGLIRTAMIGAVRFSKNGKRWGYPRADEDYVASSILVDHLIAQLKPMIVRDALAQSSLLAKALINQARIAGLGPPLRMSNPEAILHGLFEPIPEVQSDGFDENWDKIRQLVGSTIDNRPARIALQNELLARVACYQGSGNTPQAIDIARVLDAIAVEDLGGSIPDGLSDGIKAFIRSIAESKLRPQMTSVIDKLDRFKTTMSDFVDGSEKAAFIDNLQEVIRLLAASGISLSIGLRDFERQLLEFKQSPIVELVKSAEVAATTDRSESAKLLNVLGSLDFGLIRRTAEFVSGTTDLITSAEVAVKEEEENRRDSDPSPLIDELTQLLSTIAASPGNAMDRGQ